tara:strand:+ start:396 stop:668 length:273 start_codon:yes stop_codon:yes gene_type:complete
MTDDSAKFEKIFDKLDGIKDDVGKVDKSVAVIQEHLVQVNSSIKTNSKNIEINTSKISGIKGWINKAIGAAIVIPTILYVINHFMKGTTE